MLELRRRRVLGGLLAGAATAALAPALRAQGAAGTIDLEQARAEGTVTLYTSLDTKILDSIIASFTEKYGIKVEYYRGGSADVTSKVLAEADAGRLQADIVDASDVAALMLMKERGILKPYRSPVTETVPAELRDPDDVWVADRLTQAIIQYNTQRVRRQSARQLAGPGRRRLQGAPRVLQQQQRRRRASPVHAGPAFRLGASGAAGRERADARADAPARDPGARERRAGRGVPEQRQHRLALEARGQAHRLRLPGGGRADRARRGRPDRRLVAPQRGDAVLRLVDGRRRAGAARRGRQVFEPHRSRPARRAARRSATSSCCCSTMPSTRRTAPTSWSRWPTPSVASGASERAATQRRPVDRGRRAVRREPIVRPRRRPRPRGRRPRRCWCWSATRCSGCCWARSACRTRSGSTTSCGSTRARRTSSRSRTR